MLSKRIVCWVKSNEDKYLPPPINPPFALPTQCFSLLAAFTGNILLRLKTITQREFLINLRLGLVKWSTYEYGFILSYKITFLKSVYYNKNL